MRRQLLIELLMHAGTRAASVTSDELLKNAGIGINEWRVLEALSVPGVETIGIVCRDTGIHKSVVSRAITTLEDQCKIEVKRVKRTVTLKVSALGEIALHNARQFVLQFNEMAFGEIDASTRQQLEGILLLVNGRLPEFLSYNGKNELSSLPLQAESAVTKNHAKSRARPDDGYRSSARLGTDEQRD